MQLYSYDLGDIGNNTIKLDWAFIDYYWKQLLGFRLGKFKTPLALYNEILDYDMLYTQTILPQSIYNKYYRESIKSTQGINLYGKLNMGVTGILDYNLYTGSENIDTDGGVAKLFSYKNSVFKGANAKNLFGGRLKWNVFMKDLVFAASYFQTDFKYEIDTSGVKTVIEYPKTVMKVLSAEYTRGNFKSSFEYQMTSGNLISTTDMTNIGMPIINKTENEYDNDMYYGQVSYRFCKCFEGGVYYSVFNAERIDSSVEYPEYADWQKDLAVSFRLDINELWLLKFEIHHVKGIAQILTDLQPEDCKGENWTSFACKTTFNF
jgi:hypothetical protein